MHRFAKKRIISYFSITRWNIGEKRQAKAIKVYSQPSFTRGNRGPEEKHRRNDDSARLRLGKAGREGSQSLLGRVAWAIPRPDFGRRHYSHVESLHGGAVSVRYPMNYDELITWWWPFRSDSSWMLATHCSNSYHRHLQQTSADSVPICWLMTGI